MEYLVIAGGTSFIARHLLRRIDKTKYRVTAVVRHLPTEKIDGVQYVRLALTEYDKLLEYVPQCDMYLPFVWDGTQQAEREAEVVNEASYRAVLRSIEAMIRQCGCKKVILPGTCHEYKNTGCPIDEETPCQPQNYYGAYKYRLYQETAALCCQTGTELVALRMFSVYGADDRREKMVNTWMRQLLCHEPLLMTEGQQIWSFLHVEDAARAFAIAIEGKIAGGCYHLAALEHRRLRDFVEEMKAIAESRSEIQYGAVPYPAGAIPHVIFVSRKGQREFPWSPVISFSDGMREMAAHYRLSAGV